MTDWRVSRRRAGATGGKTAAPVETKSAGAGPGGRAGGGAKPAEAGGGGAEPAGTGTGGADLGTRASKAKAKAKAKTEAKTDADAKADANAKAAAPVRRCPGRFVRVLVTLTALAGMVAFAVVLARLTLEASPASVPLTHSNLTPGRSIENYLNQPGFVDTVKQLGGNIALGVPFGILLPLLSLKARGFLRVALITAATMLLVELVQGALVTGRAFDIDDVLLNTTGALLGYMLVGRRLGRIVRPRTRPRWWQRRPGDSSR
ncbi:VanZ family protein [Streptomyces sp. NPDC056525]|uniref:VanZ family protein n=1 Tax=unclassified Streptomyces TaxID=2593676 RepID=UPI00367A6AED